jgi:protein-tyrosine phosphatase
MLTNHFWQRLTLRSKATSLRDNACFWSVDMHSHLLPDLDDGVKSLEETLICLRQLADWGIQKVITTPHISQDWYPNEPEAIRQGLTALRDYITDHHLSIDVDVAAEYLLDDFFIDQLNAGDLLCFGEKRYLLVEAGWFSPPHLLAEKLYRIQAHGYRPVLAHPERYTYYHTNKMMLAELHETGCLFQLNWMSLAGRYGVRVKNQARYLLQQHWIDFIGSDLHHQSDLRTMLRLFNASDLKLLKEQPLLNATLLTH